MFKNFSNSTTHNVNKNKSIKTNMTPMRKHVEADCYSDGPRLAKETAKRLLEFKAGQPSSPSFQYNYNHFH